jgi:hypothetical protein
MLTDQSRATSSSAATTDRRVHVHPRTTDRGRDSRRWGRSARACESTSVAMSRSAIGLAQRHGNASRQMSDRFRESCASSVSRAVPSSSASPRATAARSLSCPPEAPLVWTHHFATSARPIERQRRPHPRAVRARSAPRRPRHAAAGSIASVACHWNSIRDAKRARQDLRYLAVIDSNAVSSVSMKPRPLQLLQRPAIQRGVCSKVAVPASDPKRQRGSNDGPTPSPGVTTSDDVLTPYRQRISESPDN